MFRVYHQRFKPVLQQFDFCRFQKVVVEIREKLYFLQQNLCMFAFYRPRESCFAASPVYDVIPA